MNANFLKRKVRVSPVLWTIFTVLSVILLNEITSGKGKGGQAFSFFNFWKEILSAVLNPGHHPPLIDILFAIGVLLILSILFVAVAAVIGWLCALAVGLLALPFQKPCEAVDAVAQRESSFGKYRRRLSLIASVVIVLVLAGFVGTYRIWDSATRMIWPFGTMFWFLSVPLVYLLISGIIRWTCAPGQPFSKAEKYLLLLYVGICFAIGIPIAIEQLAWNRQMEKEMKAMQEENQRSLEQYKQEMHTNPDWARPNIQWRYVLKAHALGTILDATGVAIIFEGASPGGSGGGTMDVWGPSGGSSVGSSGGVSFKMAYARGTNTIIFANSLLRITDRGRKLTIGDRAFDLTGEKKTIVIHKDGTQEILAPAGPPPASPGE